MATLKKLTLALGLALVLAASAFAGETSTPPCSPDPGETSTPPCSSNMPTSDDQIDASTLAETTAIEATVSAIESMLAIF